MKALVGALLAACAMSAAGARADWDPVPALVDVPAGAFVRGSDRPEREFAYRLDEQAYGHRVTREQAWYENEPPRGQASTGDYSITRTPITNRQYGAFVEAARHRVPAVSRSQWRSYGLIHPYERTRAFAWSKGRPPRGREDHPVVLVSREDARAYAEWLSRETGARWRLPTEAEWEKAARGTDGRYFPWGNEFDAKRLNSHDAGPFDTVPAGRYPSGASPFGMLDAAGQVYEWTSGAAGPGRAIVKGGSWDDRGCGICRPAARHGRPAELKHILIGFRLVREHLQPIARVGPWPAVSSLIGFQGRLWFANSVKFADHNSADLYSYDPKSGAVRYERHLFSQDAGLPAVAGGLLYWPFEDARFSVGRGELMVTNGRDWTWRELPYSPVLHLHAMLAHGGFLYAATGGFFAGLYRSPDQGRSWNPVYLHRNAPGSSSRLLSLQVFNDRVYAGLYASDEPGAKLGRLAAGRLLPVPGWPRGESAEALTRFRGHLYAIHRGADGVAVWRTDGHSSEPVRALAGHPARAMAAGSDALWMISAGAGRGVLWRSADGEAWRVAQRFDRDEPVDVAVYAGRPYVGAIGADVLFGPPAPAPVERAIGVAPLPAPMPAEGSAALEPALVALDRALADLASFEQAGGTLIDRLDPIIRSPFPETAQALANRVGTAAAGEDRVRFAGNRVAAAAKADWQLLWAMARIGHGRVPAELLSRRWSAARNRGEKYVEPVAGAAWAVSESRQSDAATISALIERLDRAGDPAWLAGDLIGALTALSGCRFGYDAAAWRAWWKNREPKDDRYGARSASCASSLRSDLVAVPGGSFMMGDPDGEPDEVPRAVTVKPFRMMRFEVTNEEFREFVSATGHVTDPERRRSGYVWTDRWRAVRGASWRRPQGGKAAAPGLERHPVVQVSARDAAAYCAWRGLRLPTEEEWELAARGTDGRRFPWGNQGPAEGGAKRASYGTGQCCAADASDGFLRTAPAGSFPDGASPFGLHDMAGNVWEWTASPYAGAGGEVAIRGGGWGNNPYCLRASYRHGNPPDIGLDMVGFRCAGDD